LQHEALVDFELDADIGRIRMPLAQLRSKAVAAALVWVVASQTQARRALRQRGLPAPRQQRFTRSARIVQPRHVGTSHDAAEDGREAVRGDMDHRFLAGDAAGDFAFDCIAVRPVVFVDHLLPLRARQPAAKLGMQLTVTDGPVEVDQ
jgi:hypothetical protein